MGLVIVFVRQGRVDVYYRRITISDEQHREFGRLRRHNPADRVQQFLPQRNPSSQNRAAAVLNQALSQGTGIGTFLLGLASRCPGRATLVR